MPSEKGYGVLYFGTLLENKFAIGERLTRRKIGRGKIGAKIHLYFFKEVF